MIRVDQIPEPSAFDAEVRTPGKTWLAKNSAPKRPRDLWTPYLPHLAEGFGNLCGYAAMHLEEGTVDHYLSCATHRHLAYEWSNYRFTSARMNSIKGTENEHVLDPFEIGDDWFEIHLPSLQMGITTHVPFEHRERALYTLRRLDLRDGEAIIRRRQSWYQAFREQGITLHELKRRAPLIARAVEKRLGGINTNAFDDEQSAYRRFLDGDLTLKGLRRTAPRIAEAIDAELQRPNSRP